ncbi:hypothetical protein BDE02_01G037800 [Populus trichocarpa]|nr:hypothetical protein BDE02_01G037800 [Populus trichocarpa]
MAERGMTGRGSEMAGLRGEKKKRKRGTFVLWFSFGQGKGGVMAFFFVRESKTCPAEGRRNRKSKPPSARGLSSFGSPREEGWPAALVFFKGRVSPVFFPKTNGRRGAASWFQGWPCREDESLGFLPFGWLQGGKVKLVCQGKDERQELVGLCPLLWGRSQNEKKTPFPGVAGDEKK